MPRHGHEARRDRHRSVSPLNYSFERGLLKGREYGRLIARTAPVDQGTKCPHRRSRVRCRRSGSQPDPPITARMYKIRMRASRRLERSAPEHDRPTDPLRLRYRFAVLARARCCSIVNPHRHSRSRRAGFDDHSCKQHVERDYYTGCCACVRGQNQAVARG